MHVKKQQLEPDMKQLTGSKLGKEYIKVVYCHHLTYIVKLKVVYCHLFNLYAEYIMWNTRLNEAQARNKIAGEKFNNLRCADDITLMAESEEKLNSLLKVKEESEKVGLKLSIKKTKIIASGPITSCQIDGKQWKKWQTFCGLQNHCRWCLQPWN